MSLNMGPEPEGAWTQSPTCCAIVDQWPGPGSTSVKWEINGGASAKAGVLCRTPREDNCASALSTPMR